MVGSRARRGVGLSRKAAPPVNRGVRERGGWREKGFSCRPMVGVAAVRAAAVSAAGGRPGGGCGPERRVAPFMEAGGSRHALPAAPPGGPSR